MCPQKMSVLVFYYFVGFYSSWIYINYLIYF